MQTLVQELEKRHLMTKPNADLGIDWRSLLANDCPEQSAATRESIVHWLLGQDSQCLEPPQSLDLVATKQALYRYQILRQRYLGASPQQAYRRLITRISSLVLVRNKIRTLTSSSGGHPHQIVDVLQEVLQEVLQGDRYMQQQMALISQCTSDPKLRHALLFTSLEDYCLRPVRNQPLLVYRFVNYLRRTGRGGITHAPTNGKIHLNSEAFATDDSDNNLNLLDTQAASTYQNTQDLEAQQALRLAVQQELADYLAEKLGPIAPQWLHLYLQGKSQDAIALKLNLPAKEVYRLREKISYHAMRVFALKQQPELVSEWLEISLREHNFGLTAQQWQQLWQRLTPQQQQLIELKKAGKDNEAIAHTLNLKQHQVATEWSKVYLIAQEIRSEE